MATIVGQRSPLFWKKVAGGLPVILDTSKFTGNVFYVDSGAAAASDTAGFGTTPDGPFATIDFAVGQCTANQGDVILVLPGHTETVTAAGGIALDVAGITVIGLGRGASRPTVNFTTAVAASVTVGAANITVINLLLTCSIDEQTIMVDVNADDFTLEDSELRGSSTAQPLAMVDNNGGAANAADRMTIRRCKFISYTAAATANEAIELGEVNDEILIEDNIIDGDWGNAGIHNPVGFILTNLRIRRNVIRNRQTTDHAIELVSACTGECVDNHLYGDTAASILDPGSLFCSGNKATSAIDEAEFAVPLASPDVTTNFIGVDDADNAVATTNVVANEDGSVLERLEQIQEAVNKGTGTALAANESLVDILYAANGIGTFPVAAVPANGVSLAEVIRDIWGALMGTAVGENGVQAWPAAAAPANNVSLAEAVRYIVETLIGTLTNTGGTATLGGMIGDPANTSLVSRLTTLQAELSGAAGLATFPAGAAAANAVSLAEVLRYLQENVITGTGTVLPANSSLYDMLAGANGIPVWPAAAAPANTVSIAEAIRYIVETLWGTLVNTGGTATLGGIIGDVANTSIASRLITLAAELSGAAGIATFPAGAAAANAVSIAEVLRYLQENVITGTGTVLPANQSLYDLLAGANGVATYPAAAAPANNVSIAEVLRDVWDAVRNGTGGAEPGANKSVVDAIGFDGAAAVTSTAGMLRTMNGTTFVVKKTLTSSAILQTGVDVTAVSAGGDLQILDVTLQADATGLAAGTNFTLETNNAKGSAVFLSTAVAGVNGNALMDLDSASVTSKTVVLESGKKIVAKCTVADCTGVGTIDVYLICRRLADGASLAAA